MESPLISIIIPVYNSSNYLKETLTSVKNQNYLNWECIIVDDRSTDHSLEISKQFALEDNRFRVFERPQSVLKGANGCRNYGFENAKGEFINWFDSDDVMFPNFLNEKAKYINSHIDLIIASGYSSNIDLTIRKPIKLCKTDNLYKDFALAKLKILTPSILFRKSFLTGRELFLDGIRRGQEYEFFSRLFFEIIPSQYLIINEYLFLYRSHNSSISASNKIYVEELKESEMFILKLNFERAYLLRDNELQKSSFRMLINLFQKALINHHDSNIRSIYNIFEKKLGSNNNFFLLLLFLIKESSKLLNLSFTKWDKIIKRYPIQF